jgi:hypothetical protein
MTAPGDIVGLLVLEKGRGGSAFGLETEGQVYIRWKSVPGSMNDRVLLFLQPFNEHKQALTLSAARPCGELP